MSTASLRGFVETGDLDALRRRLDADPSQANASIEWGQDGKNRCSVLHYVACLKFHGMCLDGDTAAMTRLLLDHGADLESRHSRPGGDGETPLQTAVSLYDRDVCEVLLDRGADLEAVGGVIEDGSALQLGVHFCSRECSELLVDRGASVFNLPLTAGLGHDFAFWFVGDTPKPGAGARHPRLESSEEPPPSAILARALQYASLNDRADTVEQLLDRDLDPNTQIDDASVLHWCAWWGAAKAAARLLERGADANARDPVHQALPLEWAGHRKQTLGENGYRLVPGLDDVAAVLREHTEQI